MKLTVQQHKLRSTDELDSLLEARIFELEPRLQVDETRVRLECRWEKSSAYRVAIHIVTPAPDLEAAGQDHTIRAAIGKAFMDLEDRLRDREGKPRRRLRSNRQTPVAHLPAAPTGVK
jgi:ribosome-associated translation inhibitor RaiA